VASASVRVTQFFAAIVVCLLAGLIGSIFTAPAVPTWYATLTKPALTPPAWLFGPVWTVLFILMGIALYLVWRKGWEQKGVQVATAIFAVQLVLNVLWSYFFFGLQVPFLALIETRPPLGCSLHNDRRLLPDIDTGDGIAPALPSLGDLCGLPHLRYLHR